MKNKSHSSQWLFLCWVFCITTKTFNSAQPTSFKTTLDVQDHFREYDFMLNTDTGMLQNRTDLNGSRRLQVGNVKSPLLDPLS
jgi:hypothetical protein